MCRVYKILAIAIFFSFNGILFSQISEIEYHKWQYGCNFRTDSKIYVINSKEEFDSIGDCFLINYPFEKYSIIGYRGSTGGCIRPDIDFRILKDENTKK